MTDTNLRDRIANVHAYAVTPFTDRGVGTVDIHGFQDNLRFMADRGVQVIAVGGGTGEIEALHPDELEALATAAIEAVGDQVLVVACLPTNLGQAIRLAPVYESLGVELMMAVAPQVRWREPVDLEGTFEYYASIAGSCGLPFLPYRIQPWPAEFILHLADIEQIVGLKDPCLEPLELFRAIQMVGDRFVWLGQHRRPLSHSEPR